MFFLLAVQIYVPAQLGEEQQLTGLQIYNKSDRDFLLVQETSLDRVAVGGSLGKSCLSFVSLY